MNASHAIDAHDRGLLLGDGLFETLPWDGGALEDLDAHAARMIAGCAALGLPAPDAGALEEAAVAAVEDAGLTGVRAAVRLTWTAGPGGRGLDRPDAPAPRLLATAAPSPRPTTPARLMIATVRRNEGSPASRLKTLAYLDNVLARREARAAGADEAILLNNRGEVACAATANLFWLDGETLCTPALACGVLAGTMRATVLSRARTLGLMVREVAAGADAITRAHGLFLTNSLIGARPATLGAGDTAKTEAMIGRLGL